MKDSKGFSLLELLIVVAIILILAAIAVPNLLRARMSANESSAGASSRSIATSNVTYFTMYGVGYAGTLANLGPGAVPGIGTAATADLLDGTLTAATAAASSKSGYFFTYMAPDPAPTPASINLTYSLLAQPATTNTTGKSTFCVDQTNVVRKDPTGSVAGPNTAGCDSYVGTPI